MKTIQSILVLFALILMVSCGSSDKAVESSGKNIGLQMYSLRDAINNEDIGVDSIITAIGAMGYKYVETAGYWNGTIYGMTPEEFKAKCEAAGLSVLSAHVSRSLADNPADTNWEDTWTWWDQCIATSKAAGMKYIVIPSMPTPQTVEDLQAYCDYYNAIGAKCNEAGMKFGYHNHAFEFEKVYDDGSVMYDYMMQNTDPEKVFFQLDVFWSQKGNRPASELFTTYPGRFEVLHIKDEAELGESGYMDFEDVFKNTDQAGTKYLIVEVERYNMNPIESVSQSLDYLNAAEFVKADYSK